MVAHHNLRVADSYLFRCSSSNSYAGWKLCLWKIIKYNILYLFKEMQLRFERFKAYF